ncbi:MAG: DUF2279 domain-containing protein [Marinilabiliaceae bacterium]|nr:DUF2279 domain-containing protein [Marinilabiliaceae bacterium]
MRWIIIYIFLSIVFASKLWAQPEFSREYPDTLNKARLQATIGVAAGSYLAGLYYMQYIWYKDHQRVPFHLYNDTKGWLQMDKFAHAFVAYRASYATYHAFRWSGVEKKKALLFGGGMGMLVLIPIEIFDGLYEGYGFSWGDMVANAFGTALFATQAAFFDDQIFLMKFSYSPSRYPNYHDNLGTSHAQRLFMDYNAHTYWFSGNLKRLTGNEKIPGWLNIAFGYSANGMIKEFENPLYYRNKPFPHFERYRQFLFSVDIDFSRIPSEKKWVRCVLRALNLLKLPFPTLEINRVEGLKLHPLYF